MVTILYIPITKRGFSKPQCLSIYARAGCWSAQPAQTAQAQAAERAQLTQLARLGTGGQGAFSTWSPARKNG